MTLNCSRTKESEYEQAVQQYVPMIRTAETSSPKRNNCNSPVVVFAHGASSPSTSDWMIRWRNLLANALNAVEVVTFDYPYINGGRKAPPKPEILIGFHSDVVRNVATKYPEHPLILVGKSLGARISCLVAAENDIVASAVICLGYPFKPTKGPILDQPILQLTVPIMFVQGGNDCFCPLQSLQATMIKLKVVNALHVIEHGDHSFQIAKKNLQLAGMTHEKAEESAVKAVAEFVSHVTSEEAINGPKNMTILPLQACLPQYVSRLESHVKDAAAGEQNSQTFASQPKIKEFRNSEQKQSQPLIREFKNAKLKQPTRIKRKSERIIKNKLKKPVYDEDGRGSTVDKPLYIND